MNWVKPSKHTVGPKKIQYERMRKNSLFKTRRKKDYG